MHLISGIIGKNKFTKQIGSVKNIINFAEESASDEYISLNVIVLKEYVLCLDNPRDTVGSEVTLEVLHQCMKLAKRQITQTEYEYGMDTLIVLYILLSFCKRKIFDQFANSHTSQDRIGMNTKFLLSLIVSDANGGLSDDHNNSTELSDDLIANADWYVRLDKRLEIEQLCNKYDENMINTSFADLKQFCKRKFLSELSPRSNVNDFMDWSYWGHGEDIFEETIAHIEQDGQGLKAPDWFEYKNRYVYYVS